MSERKVLNKYYPPDFDPSKIPRMKLAKNRQYTVRLMAPFNMRCKTCGEYIYKGKKFNARKEDVEGDTYLGIRIYRFYIKCTRCLQEISFKTDPKNTDYEIEAGATRNFMALKLAEEQAKREEDEEKEEEATNPMKLLEKRTQQSKQELELLESLEELKDLNRRQQTIDYDHMLEQYDTTAARIRTEKEQEEYDEQLVKQIFKKKRLSGKVVEEEIVEVEDTATEEPPLKIQKIVTTSVITSKPISIAEKRNKFGIKIKSGNKNTPSTSVSNETDQSKADDSNPLIPSPKSSSSLDDVRKSLGIKIKLISESDSIPKNTKTDIDSSSENKTNSSIDKPSGLSLLGAYSDSEEEE